MLTALYVPHMLGICLGRDAMNHDLHTHTTWSDGSHSISTQIYIARAFQLDAIAFTDHVFPGQTLANINSIEIYLGAIEKNRKYIDDLILLKGIELMALDTVGTLLHIRLIRGTPNLPYCPKIIPKNFLVNSHQK